MMTKTIHFLSFRRGHRAVGMVVLTLALATPLGLQAQRASASATTLAVGGSFTTVATTQLPPGCLSPLLICDTSTYTGTLAGTGTGAILAFVPSFDPGILFSNDTAVVHTASGDLQLKVSGVFNALPSGAGEFVDLVEVTGGTGHFTGASGHIVFTGNSTIALLGSPATPFRGTAQGTYSGQVITP